MNLRGWSVIAKQEEESKIRCKNRRAFEVTKFGLSE
jgi:hypothetical protein